MTVSVVIPVHQSAWCLPEALASVAAQTYRDFEVIVVDDGSTDGTSEVATSTFDKLRIEHASLINRERGTGLSNAGMARNTGVDAAGGNYVAFLDADDVWYPHKLERVMETFSAAGSSLVGVCHAEAVTEEGDVVSIKRYGGRARFVPLFWRLLLVDNYLSPSASVFRREAIQTVGGFSTDPRHHSAEDYDLWLRLAREGLIEFIDEPLGEYRRWPGGLSRDPELHLTSVLNVIDDNFRRTAGSRPAFWWHLLQRQRRMRAIRQMARVCQRERETRRATDLTLRALREWPISPKLWVIAGILGVETLRRSPTSHST